MSPSLASDDARSNTCAPSDPPSPHHSSDAPPMFAPSFDSFPPYAHDALRTRLSSSRLPECLRNFAASRADEHFAPTPTRVSSFSSALAVPVPAHSGAGSPFDLSPSPSLHSNGCNYDTLDEHSATYTAFVFTRSRAVKVRKHPNATFVSLRSILDSLDETPDRRNGGSSVSMWTLKDLSALDEVWVLFKSHNDACIFLSLSLPSFTTTPALEADLEPFEKLRRVDLLSRFPPLPVIQPENKSHRLRMSVSTPDFHHRIYVGHSSAEIRPSSATTQTDKFVISSNPPNPRTTFRVGDWICNSVTCAAHNFGRNLACRGCGCPRSENQVSSMNRQTLGISSRLPTSPRFASPAGTTLYTGPTIPNSPPYSSAQYGARHPLAASSVPGAKPASPSHPLLTPSGRSFSVGGKVQNISTDPSVPCIMYWPDNEPLPEQGQIRPSNLSGVPQPPILNTGNRGPIEHQPGDWICQKCNYLNWRRRKVCQTCYPYAEGNGDSISAAVQSERINLLTSLLAQNQLPLRATPPIVDVSRRNHVTPVPLQPQSAVTPPARLNRSQIDSGPTAPYLDAQFIYETSGPVRSAQPLFPSLQELDTALPDVVSTPLLPSFLQDMVRSPTLSPTSTSSADLSVEEYEDIAPSPRPGRDRVVARDDSVSNFPLGNIWRLNDEETTSIAGIALPHHEDLVGSRKSSQEILRRPSP